MEEGAGRVDERSLEVMGRGEPSCMELYWTEKDSHCTVHAVVVMM